MQGDSVMFSVAEEATTGQTTSILIANREGNKPGDGNWNCSSFTDPNCEVPADANLLWGATVFGVCESATDVNCIEDFQIAVNGEELKSATFKERPAGMQVEAMPSRNFPGGGTVTLWSAEHAPSASGTTDYMVNLRVGGSTDPRSRTLRWNPFTMQVNVIPYRLLTGERYKTPFPEGNTNEKTKIRRYGIGGLALECAWNDNGRCGRQQDFALDTKVKVVVRVSKELGGWFRGRMKDPVISVSSFNDKFNRISVEAQPVEIPKMAHFVDREEMSTTEQKYFSDSSGGMKYGVGSWYPAAYRGIFNYIEYFKKKVDDTAAGMNTVWNFGTTDAGRGSACLTDDSRVLGIVTTNAMGFDGASPSYSRGSLNYNVGGLHLRPDGKTPILGTYDLVMRSDVARCLYGLSRAPVGATITVSGEGDSNIATTVVGERNGWLKLAAYGFTFSNKTIKVKLSQKRTTITCVSTTQPTKTRKVSGVAPKCPSGFRSR
jgi:hypothetical protein